MAEDDEHEITALLFHRPHQPLPSSHSAHLNSSTTAAFISAIAILNSTDPSQIIYAAQSLDSSTSPHIFRIAFTSPNIPLSGLRNDAVLKSFETAHSLLLTLQSTLTFNHPKRLAVFDMDSTLIQQEVIDLLAAHASVEAQVSDITARAMNGELDFSASLRERVVLLKGLPASVFEELKPHITITPGVETVIGVLKSKGIKTAVLSGGFIPLAAWLAERLGIDHVHANSLEVDGEGKFTGRLEDGCIVVDAARKRELLRSIAASEGVKDIREVVAVGDGANDLMMLWEAGVGVAVNAKAKVQEKAPMRLNGRFAMEEVLWVMGISGEEIEAIADAAG